MARACELIIAIAGGEAGPIVEAISPEHLPHRNSIHLRSARITRMLGLDIEPERVTDMLQRLGMVSEKVADGWRVTPPAFRFDIAIEADLIEEIGRVHGYDDLPLRNPVIPAVMRPVSEATLTLDRVKDLLVDRGYQEAITYSFVEEGLQRRVEPDLQPLPLKNPLSAELGVMRTNLWAGLLDAALRNTHRQQHRVRLFETGLKFMLGPTGLQQPKSIAWLATGAVTAEQWAQPQRAIDFYDCKADVEAIVALTGRASELSFFAGAHPALHPGQSAQVFLGDERLGWVGMLHPLLEKELGFDQQVFLVELDQNALLGRAIPRFSRLSRFPQVRRDIALIVNESTPVASLVACVRRHGSGILRDVVVFDIYQGKGVETGSKSVAMGLFWQDDEETLVDARVDAAVRNVLDALAQSFDARLRD